jgi:NAD(P) transhydrogenase subunit alpha
MSSTAWLTVFVLAVFLGFGVISKVSSILHTPLMSGANAVHGVILVGAIIATGSTGDNVQLAIGLLAIVMATVNMVGGFAVTDRMLGMFAKPRRAPGSGDSASSASASSASSGEAAK